MRWLDSKSIPLPPAAFLRSALFLLVLLSPHPCGIARPGSKCFGDKDMDKQADREQWRFGPFDALVGLGCNSDRNAWHVL